MTDQPSRLDPSETPTDPLLADLLTMIKRRQVVVVVGSGVSMSTNRKSPSWRKLIVSGIQHCRAIGATERWCQSVSGQLELDDEPDMLLSAAELVHKKLSANGGGELARWLRTMFGSLEVVDPKVIEALAALDLPLLTTNYDQLIEEVTGLKHITWKDSSHVARFARRDDRRVLHLHGHWDAPESVVLGIRSYEAVKNNEHTQAIMRALAMTNSLLFVGCGEEGLGDPNFGNFLSWLEAVETTAGVEHRHYRLVTRKDSFPPRGRLFPIVYGESYDDLLPFLERLKPVASREKGPPGERTSSVKPSSLPDSIDHYLESLSAETSHLTLLGMERSLQIELPIAEAFVPLRTTLARSMEQRETGRFKEGHAEFEKDVELGDVFRESNQFGQRGVILLGEPGSGKTTGARQLAWRLSSGQCLPQDLGLPTGIVPVLLRFRNLSSKILAMKSGGFKEFLLAETHRENAPDGLQSPGNELWNLKSGLLWILDGMDEVIDSKAREQVSGWLKLAIEQRSQDRFLVTCRFQGYFRSGVPLGPKFVEFHVRPLTDEQVQQFVREWFAAAYAKLLGPGDRAASRAQVDNDELLRILAQDEYQTGHIRELCTNPLLLTILCIVFHEERKLPTGRAELYSHCVRSNSRDPKSWLRAIDPIYRPGDGTVAGTRRSSEFIYRVWKPLMTLFKQAEPAAIALHARFVGEFANEVLSGGRGTETEQVARQFCDSFLDIPAGEFQMGSPPEKQGMGEELRDRWRAVIEADGDPEERAKKHIANMSFTPGKRGQQEQEYWLEWFNEIFRDKDLQRLENQLFPQNETPAMPLQTVAAFRLGRTPVLNEWYRLFSPGHGESDSSYRDKFEDASPTPDCPVIFVSWYDAWAFAQWARWEEGQCRLPYEYEWECAAKAGTPWDQNYWWGDEFDATKCNAERKVGHTTPPVAAHANPWGLQDSLGNVLEWCEDWYYAVYDPNNVEEGSLRGGSWFSSARRCRSAIRIRFVPSGRRNYLGFRVALSSSGQESSPGSAQPKR